MAIIELNLEKPALKRVESVEERRAKDEQFTAETGREEAVATGDEMAGESAEAGEESSQQSGGRSRVRKYSRRMAILGGTAAGAAAVRKLRQRRKSTGTQQDLEEDWQTAESSHSSSDD